MSIYIPLSRGMAAIVDQEDAALAAGTWHAKPGKSTVYAARRRPKGSEPGPYELLHRTVWRRAHPGEPEPDNVDHRNGDGLDCRRDNLRAASYAENACNRRLQKNNSSGFVGVHGLKSSQRRKWQSYLRVHNKRIHLGTFETAALAALVRDLAAWCCYGRFASYNFPLPGERGARNPS